MASRKPLTGPGAPGRPKSLRHKRKIKRALRAYWAKVRAALNTVQS